jgi:hypothetical protein
MNPLSMTDQLWFFNISRFTQYVDTLIKRWLLLTLGNDKETTIVHMIS